MNRFSTVMFAITVWAFSNQAVYSQDDLKQQFDQLSERVDQLETVIDGDEAAILSFFCGAFCALWAQNTNRSAWLWFFLGVFFNILTVLVVLAKNSGERRSVMEVNR